MMSSLSLAMQCALIVMSTMLCVQCSMDYTVEHQLSPTGAWTVRGRLLMDVTARSGSLSIHDWSDQEMDGWHELNKQPQSMYKLRIKLSDTNYLTASVLACQLKRGDERIILHSDFDGKLVAFDYFTTNPFCTESALSSSGAPSSSALPKSLQKSVEDISILSGDKADGPFFAEYEMSPPKKEQQSLWGKYWWIILIVGFVVVQSVASSATGAQ